MIVADRCAVWLIDHANNELFTAVAHGVGEIRIPYGSGLVGSAISCGLPIFIDGAYKDPRHNSESDKKTGYRTKAIMTIPFRNNQGEVIGAYQAINKMTEVQTFSTQDMEYLSLAASYSGKSLESIMLHEEILETQKEVIIAMGEIGERRSKETGNHVKRVAQYSYHIALGLGMSTMEAEMLRIASPMHDIGKVAIPDAILQKSGKLTDEEYAVMQTHSEIGYQLLRNSKRQLMQAAAIVALHHYEKWDGSERVYKAAWSLERILALFQEEKGRQFDPKVVDAFVEQLPAILQVRDQEVEWNVK